MSEAELLNIGWTLRQRLLTEPESGMGYQLITLKGLGAFVVFNAEVALRLEAASDQGIESELLGGTAHTIAQAISTFEADKPAWLPSVPKLFKPTGELEAPPSPNLQVKTHGSYQSHPDIGELFVRYSAFANDCRINDDGTVLEGTYVTTAIDSAMVPSGLAAVARYALPNKDPAKYKFYIEAPVNSQIKCGTSTPKFGESGGGVEIRLGSGASRVANGPSTIAER